MLLYVKWNMSEDRKIFELLKEDWLELESDPGLFTLLIEDFGVKGVAVEEVYDISEKPSGPVFGFVFLFRWNGKGRRRKGNLFEDSYVDKPSIVNDMFFAYQITPNSCATHALLSVLLNCENVELGPQLTQIKEFCHGLDPESKGYTIASSLRLARSHNRYAGRSYQPATSTKQIQHKPIFTGRIYEADTFHYVSYVPIGDRLFELDGLKRGPIDHGPWGSHEEWTDLFLRVISERIAVYSDGNSDIHFSLMAVVVDHLPRLSSELGTARMNLQDLLTQVTNLAEKCDLSLLQEQLHLIGAETQEVKTSSESSEDKILTIIEAATKWLRLNKSLVLSNIVTGDVTGLPPEPLQSLFVTIAKLTQVSIQYHSLGNIRQ